MKKIVPIFLLGLISAVFADPTLADPAREIASTSISEVISIANSDLIEQPKPSFKEFSFEKTGFFYVRFAAAESMNSVLPGFGLGYRCLAGNGAADISISGIGHAERKNDKAFWTVPKASYLQYLQPDQKESFYLGAGLAWGGLKAKSPGQEFIGIISSVTGGYEFVRKGSVLGFAELNISQPTLAVYSKGDFPLPIAEMTVGIGF